MVMEDGVSFVLISRRCEDWWAVSRKEYKWQQKLNNQKRPKKKKAFVISVGCEPNLYFKQLPAPASHNRWVESTNWRTDENEWVHLWQAGVPDTSHSCLPDLWVMFCPAHRKTHACNPNRFPPSDQLQAREVVEGRQWHPLCKHIWQVRKQMPLLGPSVQGYPQQLAKCRPKGISGSGPGDHLHQLAVKEDTWGPL